MINNARIGRARMGVTAAAWRSGTAVEAAGIPETANLPRGEAVSRESALRPNPVTEGEKLDRRPTSIKQKRSKRSKINLLDFLKSPRSMMMGPKKWIKNKLAGKMKSQRSRSPLRPIEEDVLTPSLETTMSRNRLPDSEASGLARPIDLGGRLHPPTIGVSANTDPSLSPYREFAEARFAADDNAANRGAMTARGRLEDY